MKPLSTMSQDGGLMGMHQPHGVNRVRSLTQHIHHELTFTTHLLCCLFYLSASLYRYRFIHQDGRSRCMSVRTPWRITDGNCRNRRQVDKAILQPFSNPLNGFNHSRSTQLPFTSTKSREKVLRVPFHSCTQLLRLPFTLPSLRRGHFDPRLHLAHLYRMIRQCIDICSRRTIHIPRNIKIFGLDFSKGTNGKKTEAAGQPLYRSKHAFLPTRLDGFSIWKSYQGTSGRLLSPDRHAS